MKQSKVIILIVTLVLTGCGFTDKHFTYHDEPIIEHLGHYDISEFYGMWYAEVEEDIYIPFILLSDDNCIVFDPNSNEQSCQFVQGKYPQILLVRVENHPQITFILGFDFVENVLSFSIYNHMNDTLLPPVKLNIQK